MPSQTDKRGLPLPSSQSSSLLSSAKSLMMRRGSSYSTVASPSLTPDLSHSPSPSLTHSSPNPADESSAAAKHGQLLDGAGDTGDEVRFSVELTRVKNLSGLYSLDFKRLKGEAWTYAYIYQRTLE